MDEAISKTSNWFIFIKKKTRSIPLAFSSGLQYYTNVFYLIPLDFGYFNYVLIFVSGLVLVTVVMETSGIG